MEWEQFFKTAGQYYVAGRYAAFAAFIPVTGNLLHHAVEMFLKGGLSKKGVSLDNLKRFGHNLPNIWAKFKTKFDEPILDHSDDAITALHRFEDIRYPDAIVAKGIQAAINITRQGALPLDSSRTEPTYELCVQDIDELVGQIFVTVSAKSRRFSWRAISQSRSKEVSSKR